MRSNTQESYITDTPVSKLVTVRGWDGATPTTTTITVWECTVNNLSGMILPRRERSLYRHEGIAVVGKKNVITDKLELGLFLLVRANPGAIDQLQDPDEPLSSIIQAGKIWLARPETGFFDLEYQRASVQTKSNVVLTVPEQGMRITFDELMSLDPLSDVGQVGTIDSGTIKILRGSRVESSAREGMWRASLGDIIDDMSETLGVLGGDTLNASQHSIIDGANLTGILSTPTDSTVSTTPCRYMYRGGEFSIVSNLTAATLTQGLYEVQTDQGSVNPSTFECSQLRLVPDVGAAGTLDSYIAINVNPAATWTAVGAGQSTDANGMHVFTGTCSYERNSVLSNTQPATLIAQIAAVTAGSLTLSIDFGAGSYREVLTVSNRTVSLSSNGQSILLDDAIASCFEIRLIVDPIGQKSYVYINGNNKDFPLLFSSSLLTGSTNKISIGTISSTISVATWTSVIGARYPSIQRLGATIGSVLRIDGVTTRLLGLLGRKNDLRARIRYEGIASTPPVVAIKNQYRQQGEIRVSSGNTIYVEYVKCYDSTGQKYIEQLTPLTFSGATQITATTSGLAIGDSIVAVPAPTPYYCLYVISNGLTNLYMVSSTDTLTGGSLAGKMPPGYVYYRRLDVWLYPFALVAGFVFFSRSGDTSLYGNTIAGSQQHWQYDASVYQGVTLLNPGETQAGGFYPWMVPPGRISHVTLAGVNNSTRLAATSLGSVEAAGGSQSYIALTVPDEPAQVQSVYYLRSLGPITVGAQHPSQYTSTIWDKAITLPMRGDVACTATFHAGTSETLPSYYYAWLKLLSIKTPPIA